MPDDNLTAVLATYRTAHRETVYKGLRVCDSDHHRWPCDAHQLLAALDAVLALPAEWEAAAEKHHAQSDALADRGSLIVSAAQMARADAQRGCAAALRKAIPRALTGEPPDG